MPQQKQNLTNTNHNEKKMKIDDGSISSQIFLYPQYLYIDLGFFFSISLYVICFFSIFVSLLLILSLTVK